MKTSEQATRENAYRTKIAAVHSELYSQAIDEISKGVTQLSNAMEKSKFANTGEGGYGGEHADGNKPSLLLSILNTASEAWIKTRVMSEMVHPNEAMQRQHGGGLPVFAFNVPNAAGGSKSAENLSSAVATDDAEDEDSEEDDQANFDYFLSELARIGFPPREEEAVQRQCQAISESPTLSKLVSEGLFVDPRENSAFNYEALKETVDNFSGGKETYELDLVRHFIKIAAIRLTGLEKQQRDACIQELRDYLTDVETMLTE